MVATSVSTMSWAEVKLQKDIERLRPFKRFCPLRRPLSSDYKRLCPLIQRLKPNFVPTVPLRTMTRIAKTKEYPEPARSTKCKASKTSFPRRTHQVQRRHWETMWLCRAHTQSERLSPKCYTLKIMLSRF